MLVKVIHAWRPSLGMLCQILLQLPVAGHVGCRVPQEVAPLTPRGTDLLGMPKVCLVLGRAVVAPPQDPVQGASLIRVRLPWIERRSDTAKPAAVRTAMKSRAGAKYDVPMWLCAFSCRATSLER